MNILFLCTGNSCRSQMAEGFARRLGEGRIHVKSAGIEARGKNRHAVSAMAEVGIDISEQESTLLTYDMLEWADLVITLCGHADENCPILPPGTEKIHWPIDDPAKATGTDEEISAVFRRIRDEIRTKIAMLIGNMQQESK